MRYVANCSFGEDSLSMVLRVLEEGRPLDEVVFYNTGMEVDSIYRNRDRASCWCCRNRNLKELKMIYRYLPEYWQRLRGIQSRIPEPMKGKSVFELEERFEREIRAEKSVKTKEVRKDGTKTVRSQPERRSIL